MKWSDDIQQIADVKRMTLAMAKVYLSGQKQTNRVNKQQIEIL